MGGIDWTQVLVTLVAALPAIIAAVYAGRVHGAVKTPSGKPIGRQIEDALHVALANNAHLQVIGPQVGATASPRANGEEAKVDALREPELPAPEPPAAPPPGES